MDYTRARLFIKSNNFNEEQIEEFFSILQDFQAQVVTECTEKTFNSLKESLKSNA